MSSNVDRYIERSQKWPDEMTAARRILLGCGLEEALKWGKPCFSADGANIAILQEMNAFLSIMFFKGALLDDPQGLLKSQGPNSRSAMRLEFTSVTDVERDADAIRELVDEAIAVEQSGETVGPAPEPEWAPELADRLDADPEFRRAFEGLTPGRQREYNLHFSDAKKSETRAARVEKYYDKIMSGRGMRDPSK